MDKQMMKSLILEMREEKGMTFTQISNILKGEYGVIKSRQAVCGMYDRTVASMENIESPEQLIRMTDIVNLSSLGFSVDAICKIMKERFNENISSYKVRSVIDKNKGKIESIYNWNKAIVKECIDDNYSIESIVEKLTYKGVSPKKSVVKKLIMLAANEITSDLVIKTSAKVLNITGDSEIAKNVASERNLDISQRDIKKAIT